MSKSLSLTNSKDIICNSIALIVDNDIINLTDLFLLKTTTINAIISAEDLKKNNELIDLLNNNTNDDGNKFAEFAENITKLINDKASIIYVNNELNKKINSIDVYTNTQISKLLFLKSNKDESYTIENTNNLFYNKTAVDDQLNKKINSIDVYTNTQISKLLFLKSDKDKSLTTLEIENLYYNKVHINSELSKKINSIDVYTTTQMDKSLFLKSNKSESYTIENINNLFYNKMFINDQLNLKGNSVDFYNKLQVIELLKLKSDKDKSLTKVEIENAYFTKEFIIEQLKLKTDIIYTTNTFYNKTYLNNVFNNIYNKIQLDNILEEYYNKEEIIFNYYNKTALDNLKLVSQSKLDESLVNYDSITVNNEKLNKKSNIETTYTKTESNTYITTRLDSYYNKTQIIDSFVNKSLLNTYYNKEEVDLIENKFYLKASIDSKLSLKATLENTYSKSQISEILKNYNKVDQSNNYSKDEINNMLLLKLDKTTIDNYFNKTQIINSLDLKLDKSTIDNYFNKLEINTTLELKLDKSTISSYYSKSNIDQILINFYNKKEIDDKNTILNNNLIEKLNLKATLLNTYSKSNIDELLKKYNKNTDFYTKNEANILFNIKLDKTIIDNYFNKTQIINSLDLKLDKTTITEYYNIIKSNELLALKFNNSDISNYYSKSNITELLKNYLDKTAIDAYYTIIKSNELLALKFNNSDISNYYSKSNINEILKRYNNSTQQSQAINLKLDKTAIDAYYTIIKSNELLALKFNNSDISNYYSKSNINEILKNYNNSTQQSQAINLKLDKTAIDAYYTIIKSNELLALKFNNSDISNYYSKSNITELFKNYLDKTEINNKLQFYYDKVTLDSLKLVGQDKLNTTMLNYYDKSIINTGFETLNQLIYKYSNIVYLKAGSDGMNILNTAGVALMKLSNSNITLSKSVNLTTDESNTVMYIKNIRDSVASLYLETPSVKAQIFSGIGALHIMTHTNHAIKFRTNNSSDSMVIEARGEVSIHNDLWSNQHTRLNICSVRGDFYVDNIKSSLLKIKCDLGIQFLNKDNDLIFEAHDERINCLRSCKILTNEINTNLTIENFTVGNCYSSLYLKADSVDAQLYAGAKKLYIATNTNHPMYFATNRFVHGDSIKIEDNGNVIVYTNFSNPSDTILKNNQVIGDSNDIQDIFNNIEVYTYERKDRKNEKRVGFIAQDVLKAVSKYDHYKHLVGDSTIKLEHDNDDSEIDIKTLDYSRLTTILWGALKNSNKKIHDLEQRMKALETK